MGAYRLNMLIMFVPCRGPEFVLVKEEANPCHALAFHGLTVVTVAGA